MAKANDRFTGYGIIQPGAGVNRKGMPSTKPMDALTRIGGKVGRAVLGGLEKMNSVGQKKKPAAEVGGFGKGHSW